MTIDYEQLKKTIEDSGRQYDMDLIFRAYKAAETAHAGQMRLSGEPYITHPLWVAKLLVDLGLDSESVAAALLHDVVEDTDTTLEQIRHDFGPDIELLVDGVTKLGRIPFSSVEEQQAENVRKMLLAMTKDVRVMIIKLCDRLHNLRTIDAQPEDKRRQKSLETMEVYAPIAHRLGMSNIKEELEDLSLKHLDPIGYREIVDLLERDYSDESAIESMTEAISKRLTDMGLTNYSIVSRKKSIYGIYRKLFVQNRSPEEIYDIYAIRVILNTVAECYNVLGILHDMYVPIPHRFKDYISTPKPNGYQSLHTTVIGEGGMPFEVQIRTYDMHYDAEYGIAAHWKYKIGISGKDKLEDRLAWVRQLLESQKASEDVVDILRDIRSDLLPEEVYVFTPKGDVMNLPAGSTVIDFAYAIHSAVGHRMIGAKVNGRIVPITYVIKTGEMVEVITGPKDKGPSRDWLNIVRTSEAKSKIRSWFKHERRDENIAEGKAAFEKELRHMKLTVPPESYDAFVDELVKRQRLNTADELFASLGYGGIQMSRLALRAKDTYAKMFGEQDKPPEIVPAEVVTAKQKPRGGIIVEGLDNCLVRFAKCCNPVPGDDIVGFITRGHGVTVHQAECPVVTAKRGDSEMRWINVSWSGAEKEEFKASLELNCIDRNGIIADVTAQLSSLHIPIFALNSRTTLDGRGIINMTIGVTNTEHLKTVISRLAKIRDVQTVERTQK